MRLTGRGSSWSRGGHVGHLSGPTARGCWIAVGLVMLSVLAIGCRSRPRRIPYIPPDLANWSDTYRSPRGLRLHLFETTGSLAPPGRVLGGSWSEHITLQVPAFLVEHPAEGLIVVGTGLAPRLGASPEKHLGWFIAAVANVATGDDQSLVSQLKAAGFAPDEVRRVILPDCRFPATGQVGEFSEAEVVVSQAERGWARQGGPFSAVRSADLLAIRQWAPIDFRDAKPLGTFSRAHDLLGDGSVLLLDAPGYTPGTMAVVVRLPGGPIVLAGGAAPLARTLRMPVVPIVATDPDGWWESAWRIKRFRELVPGLVVVPGFETRGFSANDRSDVVVHHSKGGAEPEGKSTPEPSRRERPSFPLPDPPSTPPPLGG